MASVVALVAAATYGGADFLGGLASRRGGVLASLLPVQAGGFAVLLPALALLQPPGVLDRASVGWSVAGGAAGALGMIVFFRVLAGGLMSLGAPVTAVAAGGLPVLAGVALGERPEARAWLGIGAGLLAVGLISGVGGLGARRGGARLRAIGLALAAGAAFGLFFVCLSRTSPAAGLWPLAVARMASLIVIAAAVLAGRVTIRIEPGPLRLAFVSGVTDMLANALFLVAERRGGLALVAVLVSLYPAATVLLSLALLRERLRPVQASGVGLALLAVVLIAGS